MKNFAKNKLVILFLAIIFCIIFTSCAAEKAGIGKGEFTICIEEQNYNIPGLLKKYFKQNYPEISLKFIKAPLDLYQSGELAQADKERTKKIKTEIMSGSGPDLYIMPVNNMQLPPDVYKCALSGVFADLTKAASSSDNFSKCNSVVMASGVVGKKQYIIPLSFNVISVLSSQENAKKLKDKTCTEILKFIAAENGDSIEINNVITDPEALFSSCNEQMINWENGTASESAEIEELAKCFKSLFKNFDTGPSGYPTQQTPYRVASIERKLQAQLPDDQKFTSITYLLNSSQTPLALTALPNSKNGVTASVQAFAAVSNASKHKDIAKDIIFNVLLSKEWMSSEDKMGAWQLKSSSNNLPVREDCVQRMALCNASFLPISKALPLSENASKEILKIYDNINAATIIQKEKTLLLVQMSRFIFESEVTDYSTIIQKIVKELQFYLDE